MKRLALLLPTRNKPEELERIFQELEMTTTCVDLYFYVAGNDPQLAKYRAMEVPDFAFGYIGGEELGFSGAVNFMARNAFAADPDCAMAMRCEDDFYFEQPGWDVAYLNAIPKHGVAMVWCNYVLKGPEAEPHTAAVSRKWYEALGYFSLPGIKHYFCDNVLLDMAKAVGCAFYLPTPYINHKHNAHDPRKDDPQRTIVGKALWDNDTPIYKTWREGAGFREDCAKLRALL